MEWIYFAVAVIAGVVSGAFTGLTPGIHVNTLAALVVSAASSFTLGISGEYLIAFVAALAISHTLFDVVPGLFLGIPGDSAYALLPGHRMVVEGKGLYAIRLSVWSSWMGLALALGMLVLVAVSMTVANLNPVLWLYEQIKDQLFWLLLAICLVLLWTEANRSWALLTFTLSGLLGILVFGSPMFAGGSTAAVNGIFPALAGMFGVAGLLYSLHTLSSTNSQVGFTPCPALPKRMLASQSVLGCGAGVMVGLLPGLGSANAATLLLLLQERLGSNTSTKSADNDERYLVSTSSLNSTDALVAIAALYLIERSRSGASIAIEQIISGPLTLTLLATCVAGMALGGVLAGAILLRIAKPLAQTLASLNVVALSSAVIVFLVILTTLLLNWGGLLVLCAATIIGFLPIAGNVRRAQLMGFFLVPTLLFFSGYGAQIYDLLKLQATARPAAPPTLNWLLITVLSAVALAVLTFHWLTRTSEYQGNWKRRLVTLTLPAALLSLGACQVGYPTAPVAVTPAYFEAVVERVIDGDTIETSIDGRPVRLRLAHIDAPELNQPFGQEAKLWLENTLGSDTFRVRATGMDHYGRFLAELTVDGTNINEAMIRQGLAWVYLSYREDPKWMEMETATRSLRLGIWQSMDAMAPWEWRQDANKEPVSE